MERKQCRVAGVALYLLLVLHSSVVDGDLSTYYPRSPRLQKGTLLPLLVDKSVNELDAEAKAEIFAICNANLASKLVADAKARVASEDTASASFNATDQAGNLNPAISAHYQHFLSDNLTATNAVGRIVQYILSDLLEEFANRSTEFQQLCVTFVTQSLNASQISATCTASIACDAAYAYRTADGSCNNLQHPNFGMANTRLQRFTGTAYNDGVLEPRARASDGTPLPSARKITNWSVSRQPSFDEAISHMVMQWGQFLDHDISVSPMMTAPDGTPIVCCAEDLKAVLNLSDAQVLSLQAQLDKRPECFNIPVPKDDQRFKNRTCVNFVRSAAAPSDDCAPRHREQLNSLTSFIDGSMIYGSTQAQQNAVRSFTGGSLRVQIMPSMGTLMPKAGNQTCHNTVDSNLCFIAGDSRSNEQPALASIHTAFVREHNRIAAELAALNPSWNDETVFQETRRIVAATVQHITYSEFLPVILGKELWAADGLAPLSSGYFKGYDSAVDARVRTEFSTVAFRFGHTLLRDCFSIADTKLRSQGCFLLGDNFFKPDAVYNGTMHGPDGILRGLLCDRSQRFDSHITTEVVDRLFTAGNPSSLDLPAFNIQRARDHGIPSYVELRRIVGMSVPQKIDDLASTHNGFDTYIFTRLYKSVADIDGFAGGVSEKSLPNAVLGPLFAKIVSLQMQLAKTGDRFYYEGDAYPSPFTPAQLSEIRKVSLNRVLCSNVVLDKIPTNPFYIGSPTNPWTRCSAVPSVNLSLWKVTPPQ